jgi:hypothetical protein
VNKQDEAALTEAWHSDTNWLNEKIDGHFKAAQDHAYALGLSRGLAVLSLTDDEIWELAEPFGEFQYGDAQGHKRLDFARAVLAAARGKKATT